MSAHLWYRAPAWKGQGHAGAVALARGSRSPRVNPRVGTDLCARARSAVQYVTRAHTPQASAIRLARLAVIFGRDLRHRADGTS